MSHIFIDSITSKLLSDTNFKTSSKFCIYYFVLFVSSTYTLLYVFRLRKFGVFSIIVELTEKVRMNIAVYEYT